MSFERPTALKPDIEQEVFAEGLFVKVSQLKNLPEHITQQVPEGFVLKMYQVDRRKEMHFLYNSTDLPAAEKASILKKRYETVKEYFDAILPGVVAKTNFFVSRLGKDGKSSPLYHISPKVSATIDDELLGRNPIVFEVQEKMEGMRDYRSVNEMDLRQFPKEEQLRIFADFETICNAVLNFRKEDPAFHDLRVLDVYGGGNLALSIDGKWKIVDTNYWYPADEVDDSVMRMFVVSMQETLKKNLERIREIVNKTA